MRIRKETITNYILNEQEGHIVRHCLEYCLHRLTKHKETGLERIVKKDTVKEILEDFNN